MASLRRLRPAGSCAELVPTVMGLAFLGAVVFVGHGPVFLGA